MKSVVFCAGLSAALVLAMPVRADDVAAVPMAYRGETPIWPRLIRFPDKEIMVSANAILSEKEKEARAEKSDCYKMLREAKRKPDADTYSTGIKVAYLSQRYMSVMVRTSSYCGGAYPNNGIASPVTMDLTHGKPIDWPDAFKPGFLSGGDKDSSVLAALYRARYPKNADPMCKDRIGQSDPFEGGAVFHLDAGRGLVVQPEFPHAIAACAKEVALWPPDLEPYLKDETLLADLRETMK